jgi:hypothetical protein
MIAGLPKQIYLSPWGGRSGGLAELSLFFCRRLAIPTIEVMPARHVAPANLQPEFSMGDTT